MSETIYSRAPDVVWRLGPDRVLVRRIGGQENRAHDLQGAAALVWITLDEPGTASDTTERLVGAGLETEPGDTIQLLLDERIIIENPKRR